MTAATKREGGWALRILAVVVLLGMMMAPLCGTLCAGSFCAGLVADSRIGSLACHGTGPTSGDSSHARLHSQKSCTAPEFPLATLSKDETSLDILVVDLRSALPAQVSAIVEADFAPGLAFERWLPGFAAPHPQRHAAVSSVLLI
jgi:hypothetical protein